MTGEFYVQIVRVDGLGKLFGPTTWSEAIAKVKAYVALNGPTEGESEECVASLIEEGNYDWGNGEGIYVVQSEPIDAPFDEDEDVGELYLDEEDHRDEKYGLYGDNLT